MRLVHFVGILGLGTSLIMNPVALATTKIGALFDRSGGTAGVGIPYSDAIIDYFKYRESQGKGFADQTVQLIWHDYAYEIPRAFSIYGKLMKETPAVMFGWGTGDTTALSPKITSDKMPYISASYSEEISNGKTFPYNFFVGASYDDQMVIALKYVRQDWKSKGSPKVAFVYPDNGFGRAPIPAGKAAAKQLNIEITGDYHLDLKAFNADKQVEAIKSAGADYVIIQSVSSATVKVANSAKKVGFQGKIVGLAWAFDDGLATVLGKDAPAIYGVTPFRLWTETSVPGVALAHKIRKASVGKSERMPIPYLQGLSTALVLEEAFRRIGDNPTSSKVKTALESIKNWDPMGLTPPVTFSPEVHKGVLSARVIELKGGEITPVTNYISIDESIQVSH